MMWMWVGSLFLACSSPPMSGDVNHARDGQRQRANPLNIPHDVVMNSASSSSVHEATSGHQVEVPVMELLGHVDPRNHPDFSPIPAVYSSREGLVLRTEARDSLVAMADAARKEGLQFIVLSATRTFDHQVAIWERKWKRPAYMGWGNLSKAQDILNYSAMPGSSRHHWGTDVDIFSLETHDFHSGEGAELLAWMRSHAARFGFEEVYDDNPLRTGYRPEPWHWSFMPLAGPFLNRLDEALQDSSFQAFDGFAGSEYADSLEIVARYMHGLASKTP